MTTASHIRASNPRAARHRRASDHRPVGRRFTTLLAFMAVCAALAAAYEIVGAAVQDGMIAAILTLLLYLPFVALFASRR